MAKFRKIRKHTFKGKEVRFEWKEIPDIIEKTRGGRKRKVRVLGWTDPPDAKNRTITIDPTLSQKDLIRSLVDEGLHVCNWKLRNDVVDKMSDFIGDLIYRIGFRLKRK